jgi:hypothetical protein
MKSLASKYIQLFLEAKTQSFIIPSKLKSYYRIDDDIRNSKNWQGKILVLNNSPRGNTKKKGDFEQIRYIAIDLNSNMIVPITILDEHQTGYEMLDVIKKKGLLPKGDWITIDSWGTNYIYDNEEHKSDMLMALKKFLEYGGDPKSKVQAMGGTYLGTIEDFISRNGNIKIGKNEIAKLGQDIIDSLEYIAKEYLRLEKIKLRGPKESDVIALADFCKYFLGQFLDIDGYIWVLQTNSNVYKDYLTEAKIKKWIQEVNIAEEKLDYVGIVQVIFSANGLKNNLHECLKIASKLEGYNKRGFESVFGDIDAAIQEFNRIAQI